MDTWAAPSSPLPVLRLREAPRRILGRLSMLPLSPIASAASFSLCVEPLDHTPRGRELAAVALRVMRDQFSATAGAGDEALLAAFAAANTAVLAENRPFTGGRGNRRIWSA